jgi:transcriptional repressor NrdR
LRCPYCFSEESKVIDTTHDSQGGIRRRRECEKCGKRYSTYERLVRQTPLIVKRDSTREEFDHEKLLQGLRTACTKRPITASQMEGLVDEVESSLQQMGRSEVTSRVVGDLVINRLKKLDHIAYIRYASVYLQMADLSSIRDEIDKLLES